MERLEEGQAELQKLWLVAHANETRLPLSAVRRTVDADYMQVGGCWAVWGAGGSMSL